MLDIKSEMTKGVMLLGVRADKPAFSGLPAEAANAAGRLMS